MLKGLLVFSLLFPESVFAVAAQKFCLRHPEVSMNVFERNLLGCRALPELATEIADDQLGLALSKATRAIDRNPDRALKIWKSFWTQMQSQAWSPEHAAVAHELREKLGMQESGSAQDFTFGAEGDLKN